MGCCFSSFSNTSSESYDIGCPQCKTKIIRSYPKTYCPNCKDYFTTNKTLPKPSKGIFNGKV